jgi:hypothetical protein
LDTEHLTDRAKAALLALYRLGDDHAGALVPHELLAADLGWPVEEAVDQVGMIPLRYAVDGYRASRLTAAGRSLARTILGKQPLGP